MATAHAFIWLLGNHDPLPPEGMPGATAEWWELDGIVFRHEAGGTTARKSAATTTQRRASPPAPDRDAPLLRRRPHRLMLPAFGAFTGGLDVRHPAIARLFPRGSRAFLLGRSGCSRSRWVNRPRMPRRCQA